MPAKNVDT